MSRGNRGTRDSRITFCIAKVATYQYCLTKPTNNNYTGKGTWRTVDSSLIFVNISKAPILANPGLTSSSSCQISSEAPKFEGVIDEHPSRCVPFPFVSETSSSWLQSDRVPSVSHGDCHGTSLPRHNLLRRDEEPLPLWCSQDFENSSGPAVLSKGPHEDLKLHETCGITRRTKKRTKRPIKAVRSVIAEDRCNGQISSAMEKCSASINYPFDRPWDIYLPGPFYDPSCIQPGTLISETKQVTQNAGSCHNRPGTSSDATGMTLSATYNESKPTRRRLPSLSLEYIHAGQQGRSRSQEGYFIIDIGPPSCGPGSPQTIQFDCDPEVVQPSLFQKLSAFTSTVWPRVSQLCIWRRKSRKPRRRIQFVVVLVTVVGAPTCVSVLSGVGTNSLVITGVVTAIIAFGKFLFDLLGGSRPELKSDMIFDCQP